MHIVADRLIPALQWTKIFPPHRLTESVKTEMKIHVST